MKISYNWLKEFVDIDLSPRDLATRMTMAGQAVDAIEEHGNDAILDFELTSNRPDCLSHLGLAREVATVLNKPLRRPEISMIESTNKSSEVTSVEVLDQDLCPRYTARVIRGVKVGPSPEWLVSRLEAFGQRSVNNVADITNYVMLELGQPLHAFDLERLAGQRIVVRRAKDKEKITLLDGEERELNPDVLVICDAENPVALGGVKGGLESGISGTTTNVLLEAAYFNPASIRQTAKNIGVNTEASYRFERGADFAMSVMASNRATALIAEICGGEILADIIDVGAAPPKHEPITMRLARYQGKVGLPVELSEAVRILRALGLQVETTTDSLTAIAPSWRHDLNIEEDLIEEVARVIGYDKLPTSLPGGSGAGAYLKGDAGRRAARKTLTSLGYYEAVSFSFVNAENDAAFTTTSPTARLVIANPIDATQATMRTTLLSGLIDALLNNLHHGTRNVRLFEIGKCFAQHDGKERPYEPEKLALVATGVRNETDWQSATARYDFYDFKGAFEAVIESLNLPALNFAQNAQIPYLHPGRAAVISLNNRTAGYFGQLHPSLATQYKFKQPVFLGELDLGMLLETEVLEARYKSLPKFPTVLRDVAILIDRTINWAEVEKAINSLHISQLEDLRLFDLYAGKELPDGKHSLALSLRYRAADRTLTDSEINAMHERVVSALREQCGAELR